MRFEAARNALDRLQQRAEDAREYARNHPARQRFERSLPGRTLQNYLEDDVDGLAGMLAYNALFSLVPVLAAISIVIGILVQNTDLRDELSMLLTDEIPASLAEPVVETTEVADENRESFGLIALITLLYGGSRLYGALDRAFAVVYKSRRRAYFERKLFAFLVAPALAMALLVSTVVSATATGLLATSLGRYLDLGGDVQDFASVYLVAFLLGFAMSLLAYAWIPVNGAGWGGSVPGAIAAGVLFVLLSQLYPLYISLTGGYSTYGAALGLVLLFMFWLYLAAQIIVIGAEICAVTSGARERNQRGDSA